MKILNKEYNISNKLNKCIVLISDMHYKDKNDLNRLNYILKEIKKHKPNYICIPGDIIDKSIINDEKEFIQWLKKLSEICKVIISLGNHEFYMNKYINIYNLNTELMEKIKNINNIYLLDNENIILDNVNFIGITPAIQYYDESKKLNDFHKYLDMIKVENNCYNILLCHNPLYLCNENILEDKNIDLILCGHTHGGVVPKFLRNIFKSSGIISPKVRLFPKNVYGRLNIGKTNIIISSGLKMTPINFVNRFLYMEIVKIKI